MQIGSFFNIPVKIHWSCLFLLLLNLDRGFEGILISFAIIVFVILHEFGHAITAQRLGHQVREIVMFPFGGIAYLEPRETYDPLHEFVITFFGPFVNFVFFAWFWVLFYFTQIDFLNTLASINFILFAFNAFCLALPMDAGRMLRSSLCIFGMNFLKATQISVMIGRLIFVSLAVFGILTTNPLMVFISFMGFLIGSAELENAKNMPETEKNF